MDRILLSFIICSLFLIVTNGLNVRSFTSTQKKRLLPTSTKFHLTKLETNEFEFSNQKPNTTNMKVHSLVPLYFLPLAIADKDQSNKLRVSNNSASRKLETLSFEMTVVTDNEPYEISWELVDNCDNHNGWNTVMEGGPYDDPGSCFKVFTQSADLPNSQYILIVQDGAGDGMSWCPQGSGEATACGEFSLTVDGVEVVSGGGDFGYYYYSEPFGNCGSTISPSSAPSLALSPTPAKKKFLNREELIDAIDEYVGGDQTEVIDDYGDIPDWDVSEVTSFVGIFSGDRNSNLVSFDPDVSQWNTTKAKKMGYMFKGNTAFQRDLSGWDVSGVYDFAYMFTRTTYNGSGLDSWDVSSGQRFIRMFSKNDNIDGSTITGWNPQSATNMNNMFEKADGMTTQLCAWNSKFNNPSVVSVTGMFSRATSCPYYDLYSSEYDEELNGINYLCGLCASISI